MTLARNEPRTHFRRARGYALSFGIVLATGLSASCLSYTTGANSPKAPSSLGTAPPSVAFVFGSPRSDLAAELRHAFASSPHFSNTFDERADADVVLAIDTTRGVKGSSWVIVNIVFLGLLPLPVQNEDRVVLGRMKVGTLDEVALPRVERRTHYWGGLPLLPLFFIQSNESKVRARMAEDVVTHVAAEYSKLHTSTWNAANVDGAIDTLEAFVVSFPTSTHGADARRTLDNQLYAAVQRNGRAQDYLRYLRRFPDSARAPEVRAQGAEPTWTVLSAIPDQERLEEYLEAFEGSPYIARRTRRWKRSCSIEPRTHAAMRTCIESA